MDDFLESDAHAEAFVSAQERRSKEEEKSLQLDEHPATSTQRWLPAAAGTGVWFGLKTSASSAISAARAADYSYAQHGGGGAEALGATRWGAARQEGEKRMLSLLCEYAVVERGPGIRIPMKNVPLTKRI